MRRTVSRSLFGGLAVAAVVGLWLSIPTTRADKPEDVDKLNKQNHEILAQYMIENTDAIQRSLHWMVVSKSLERIADHATNIAEEVVYLCEGRDIRHTDAKNAPVTVS